MDGQEIRRVVQLRDQPQFVPSVCATSSGKPLGIALGGALPGQLLQRLLWGQRGSARSSGYW